MDLRVALTWRLSARRGPRIPPPALERSDDVGVCLVVAPSQRGQLPWALVFRIFLYSCLLCTPIVFKAALAEASGAWQVAQWADTRAFALCLLVLPRSQRWVERLNEGLRASAGGCLAAFVICDIASALALYGAIAALNVRVGADFVVAYGLAKSVRVPRLVLDAAAAAALARACPPLAAVEVGRIVDAGERALAAAAARLRGLAGLPERQLNWRGGGGDERPSGAVSRAAALTRRLTSEYGLAYMAVKNIIGPLSALLFYALLKHGVNVEAALASAGLATLGGGGAGGGAIVGAAAQMCLASQLSTLLFPGVVAGAALLGPRLGAMHVAPLNKALWRRLRR